MALSTAERDIVKQAAALIGRETAAGEKIILQGFGTFTLATKAPRNARNPKTGAMIAVPAKTAIKFKPAPSASKTV